MNLSWISTQLMSRLSKGKIALPVAAVLVFIQNVSAASSTSNKVQLVTHGPVCK